jgi:hypothetical protein
MAERDVRERDILVASNEYAYVQDLTKGDIVLYVGPTKISLSNTERVVEYREGRFVPVRAEDGALGISPFVAANSAQYIVLENPPREAAARPIKGNNTAIDLLVGRKVVVPGPASFPLWPGQLARVVDGHALEQDQYLRARVYEVVDGDPAPIGSERIVKGTDVNFYIPRTGLEVVPDARGSYVRSAIPMRLGMGLHLRAVKDFVAGAGDLLPTGRYAAGQEIFLEGRDGYFFPTENLDVLGEVRAIPVAEKEGLYVRELATGRVTTVLGPVSFLPDPTRVQLVERQLQAATMALYRVADRRDPRRAVAVYIPPNHAVLVTAQSRREVVKGPQTRVLDYNEDLEVLQLSTGKPKASEHRLATCLLQIDGNKVSDVVRVKTRDHVELDVSLSYRVSFVTRGAESDASRWFNVNDYVALLCDHLGSLVRAAVRSHPIDSFHATSAAIVRNAVLGEKHEGEPRAGRFFEENGMWLYDVEVLDVVIRDEEVLGLLSAAQRAAIESDVFRKHEELRLANERLKEAVTRDVFVERAQTLSKEVEVEVEQRRLSVARAEGKVEVERREKLGRAENEAAALEVSSAAQAAAAERDTRRELELLAGRVGAFKEQMAALHPELVATLKMLGNQHLAAELTRNLSPLAILGGESVSEVAERLLRALPIGTDPGNGPLPFAAVKPLTPKPGKGA